MPPTKVKTTLPVLPDELPPVLPLDELEPVEPELLADALAELDPVEPLDPTLPVDAVEPLPLPVEPDDPLEPAVWPVPELAPEEAAVAEVLPDVDDAPVVDAPLVVPAVAAVPLLPHAATTSAPVTRPSRRKRENRSRRLMSATVGRSKPSANAGNPVGPSGPA